MAWGRRATAMVALVAAIVMVTTGSAVADGGAANLVAVHGEDEGARVSARPAGRIAADPIAHDPTVVRDGRFYYSFSTGDVATHTYLPFRRSADLVHWTDLGAVFATAPAWVTEALGFTPADFWA